MNRIAMQTMELDVSDTDPEATIREELATLSTLELVDRSFLGLLLPPLFLLLIALTTPYYELFPEVILTTAALFVVLGLVRLYIGLSLKKQYSENPNLWRRLFRLGIYSSAVAWGTFVCVTLALNPADSWMVLLMTAALGAAMSSSLTANFSLAIRYLSFLLGPALVWSLLYSYEQFVIAIVSVLYLVYMFQAKEQNQWYERAISVNARLAARTLEVEKARDAADAANRAKSEFLAHMSHDLRTPMNAIIGMTDLLLDSEISAEQEDRLTTVRSSSDSLLGLVNDILDFSKIEAGKFELDQTPFGLEDCVRDTARSLAVRAEEKGIELTCDVPDNLPETLVGDPGRLRQILTNLVGNAIKFTEQGKVSVELKAGSQGEEEALLQFSVTDTGIGIPPERLEHIFGAFEQVDLSTTRKYGGTGLGLAIVARLVNMMGGEVWVDSVVGEGSAFHFTARFGMPTTQQAVRVSEAGRGLDGLRVLVLEDDPTGRGIERFLKSFSMRVTTVESERAALEELEEATGGPQPYDLVLMRYSVPTLDGFDLAERIDRSPELSGTRVMMLASEGQIGDGARCKEAGVSAYLTGTVARSELRHAIVAVIGSAATGDKPALVTRHSLRESVRPLRILLAEDNRANQKVAKSLLERRGHSVVIAQNGKEAVETASTEQFDLVLMDIQMPAMDGFEATSVIREWEEMTGEHIPIVAMTAHAIKGYREQCLEAGMDGYIAKPINPDELIDTLAGFDCAAGDADVREHEEDDEGGGPIDEAEALKRAGGDRELLGQIAEIILEDSPNMMAELRAALDAGDCEAVQRSAHALKGCVGNVSAKPAWKVAERLEHMGRDGDISESEAVWESLSEEINRLTPVLEDLRAS